MVTVDFQSRRPNAGGTLSFRFGQTRIDFPDCRINTARGSFSSGRRIQFQILDRRWKWQPQNGGGFITGKYNIRQSNGRIKPGTEKSPQQLAAMLLEAMGETGFDVSRLPGSARPAVDWVYANPSQELARLCDTLGCRVVLHLDNRVRLHRKGVGAPLPEPLALTHSYGIDPPERPDRIVIVGEPTLFQSRLKLAPIGQDTDGSYKPVDKLSFKPARGWQHEDPAFFTSLPVDSKSLQLAKRDVFRLYEISVEQADGSKRVPGYNGPEIDKREKLLPLQDGLLSSDGVSDGSRNSRPAEVFGVYFDDVNNPRRLSIPTWKNTKPGTNYPGSFTVDAARGYVRFQAPVYRIGTDQPFDFPELTLACAYAVSVHGEHQKHRHTKARSLPGPRLNTGARIVRINDLRRTVVAQYNGKGDRVSSLKESTREFDREADYYLDQHAARYANVETNDVTYAGILPLDLDGLRQQVTWKVGGGPATTQISTNTEHNFAVPPYERRRQRERAETS